MTIKRNESAYQYGFFVNKKYKPKSPKAKLKQDSPGNSDVIRDSKLKKTLTFIVDSLHTNENI
jgi:hypothetical protein